MVKTLEGKGVILLPLRKLLPLSKGTGRGRPGMTPGLPLPITSPGDKFCHTMQWPSAQGVWVLGIGIQNWLVSQGQRPRKIKSDPPTNRVWNLFLKVLITNTKLFKTLYKGAPGSESWILTQLVSPATGSKKKIWNPHQLGLKTVF